MSRKPHKANRSDPFELFQGLQFHGCLLADVDDEDELRGLSANVRFGSEADIQRYPLQCPLLGVKRTLAGA